MSPLWCVLLLIVASAIWVIGRESWAAGREWYRALPQSARESALLATIGLWVALLGVTLRVSPNQPSPLPVVAHWWVAALALLTALYRSRNS